MVTQSQAFKASKACLFSIAAMAGKKVVIVTMQRQALQHTQIFILKVLC
jgi:hypothetical protein